MLEKMPRPKENQATERLIVGTCAAILLFICIWISAFPYFRPFFTLILSLVVGGALFEYYKIAKAKGFFPLETIGIVCSVLYVVAVFLSTQSKALNFLPDMMLLFTGLIVFTNYFVKDQNPLANTAITFFGVTNPASIASPYTSGFRVLPGWRHARAPFT